MLKRERHSTKQAHSHTVHSQGIMRHFIFWLSFTFADKMNATLQYSVWHSVCIYVWKIHIEIKKCIYLWMCTIYSVVCIFAVLNGIAINIYFVSVFLLLLSSSLLLLLFCRYSSNKMTFKRRKIHTVFAVDYLFLFSFFSICSGCPSSRSFYLAVNMSENFQNDTNFVEWLAEWQWNVDTTENKKKK